MTCSAYCNCHPDQEIRCNNKDGNDDDGNNEEKLKHILNPIKHIHLTHRCQLYGCRLIHCRWTQPWARTFHIGCITSFYMCLITTNTKICCILFFLPYKSYWMNCCIKLIRYLKSCGCTVIYLGLQSRAYDQMTMIYWSTTTLLYRC